MKTKIITWGKKGLVFALVAILSAVATNLYAHQKTEQYVQKFKDAGGQQILSEISDTYKTVIEYYSNYKLSQETKVSMMKKLEALRDKLKEVDRTVNQTKPGQHRIDFSFVLHDMKLVRLSLSDTTKDDIIPVIVLHASEGLKELEKEITYIEYQ